jgi:hypothetical protein
MTAEPAVGVDGAPGCADRARRRNTGVHTGDHSCSATAAALADRRAQMY